MVFVPVLFLSAICGLLKLRTWASRPSLDTIGKENWRRASVISQGCARKLFLRLCLVWEAIMSFGMTSREMTNKLGFLFPHSLLPVDSKHTGNPIFKWEFHGNENYHIFHLILILMRHTYNWVDIRMLHLLHREMTHSLVMLNLHPYQKQLK